MKQYCRYCAYMCCGDANYCEKNKKCYSEEKIKQVNKCKDFIFNESDALGTGNTYKPRKKKRKKPNLFDLMG